MPEDEFSWKSLQSKIVQILEKKRIASILIKEHVCTMFKIRKVPFIMYAYGITADINKHCQPWRRSALSDCFLVGCSLSLLYANVFGNGHSDAVVVALELLEEHYVCRVRCT